MASSSFPGGTERPAQVRGKNTGALGPGDNSDSGSDAQGAYGEGELASDSDAVGTGERATAGAGREQPDADLLPDRSEPEVNAAAQTPLFDDADDVNNIAAQEVDPADLSGASDGDGEEHASAPDRRPLA